MAKPGREAKRKRFNRLRGARSGIDDRRRPNSDTRTAASTKNIRQVAVFAGFSGRGKTSHDRGVQGDEGK
jgi:hypothetical protein